MTNPYETRLEETNSAKLPARASSGADRDTGAGRSLRGQVSWTLSANLIYGVCNLLLIVILNRFGSKAIAGQYGLALAITAPLFMFANLRFSTILATDVQGKAQLADYFSLRSALLVGACALAIPLAYLNQSIAAIVLVLGFSKAIEAISELCCGVQQRIGRIDRIAISLIANGLLMAGAFFVVFYATRDLVLACIAICVSRLLVLSTYDAPKARSASKHGAFSQSEVGLPNAKWSLLATSVPLGFTAALISLTSNIPRYTIPSILDEDTLGVFVSLAVVLQAGNLVFRSVEIPTIPRLAHFIDRRDRRNFWLLLARAIGLFAVVGLAGVLVGHFFGEQILVGVFGPAYTGFGRLLTLMILCTTFSQFAGMIESSLIASRITAVQIPMHCVTALSCLGLCVWLIPGWRLYGAAFAVTLCRLPFVVIGLLLIQGKLAAPSFDSSPVEADATSFPNSKAA